MKIQGIYELTSPSGKMYIGQSTDIEKRLKCHFKDTINHNTKFGSALKKYPNRADWKINIREMQNPTNNELDMYEIELIKFYNSFEDGYNGTTGGNGSSGFKQTAYAKEVASRTHKGAKRNEQTKKNISKATSGENNPMFGKNHTLEARAKLRNLSLGNKNCLGHIHSEERKEKNRQSQLNLPEIKCPHCEKMIKNKGNLTQHIRSRHPQEHLSND